MEQCVSLLPGKVSSSRDDAQSHLLIDGPVPSLGNYPPTLLEKEEISMKMRLSDRADPPLLRAESSTRLRPAIEKADNVLVLLCDAISRDASGRRKDMILSERFETFSSVCSEIKISRWIHTSYGIREITTQSLSLDLTIDILSQISSKRFATSTRTARIRSDEFEIRI